MLEQELNVFNKFNTEIIYTALYNILSNIEKKYYICIDAKIIYDDIFTNEFLSDDLFDIINQAITKCFSLINIKKLKINHKYYPYKFYLLKDKISAIDLCEFSEDRTSPIIVFNDKVKIQNENSIASNRDYIYHYDLIKQYKNNINNSTNEK